MFMFEATINVQDFVYPHDMFGWFKEMSDY